MGDALDVYGYTFMWSWLRRQHITDLVCVDDTRPFLINREANINICVLGADAIVPDVKTETFHDDAVLGKCIRDDFVQICCHILRVTPRECLGVYRSGVVKVFRFGFLLKTSKR